jgi:hypothetical protein
MFGTTAEMLPASSKMAKMATAQPFRKPPGLELLPPPGLELPPPPGLEQLYKVCGTQVDAEKDADALSSCSTAETAEVLELPPPPGLERLYKVCGTQMDAETEVDALRTCSTAETAKVLDSGITGEFADVEYVPGRLLQGIVLEAPAPVTLELDKCVEQPTMIPPPPAPVGALPSLGSADHACGSCHPCEFFHRQRCRAGASCKFCHLCGPEELKARRKAKRAVKRMQGEMQLQVCKVR